MDQERVSAGGRRRREAEDYSGKEATRKGEGRIERGVVDVAMIWQGGPRG